jgi:hypothetical protein
MFYFLFDPDDNLHIYHRRYFRVRRDQIDVVNFSPTKIRFCQTFIYKSLEFSIFLPTLSRC